MRLSSRPKVPAAPKSLSRLAERIWRVHENGSAGTDHGTAEPLFVLGGAVQGGLHGSYPSLATLDRGDLVHTTDFRSVYASIIQSWLGANPGG